MKSSEFTKNWLMVSSKIERCRWLREIHVDPGEKIKIKTRKNSENQQLGWKSQQKYWNFEKKELKTQTVSGIYHRVDEAEDRM